MNWLKIISEFERFVFQVTVLIVLAPKTFIKISLNPGWVSSYLFNESRKDVEERFDEYLSPIVYWIIFSVIILVFQVLFWEHIGATIGSIVAGAISGGSMTGPIWTDFNLDDNRFAQAIVVSIWYPLAYSTIPVLWITKRITRKTMELPFYLQCYAFGTFFTIYTTLGFVLILFNVGDFAIGAFPHNYIALLLSLTWLFWFENTFLIGEAVRKLSVRLAIFFIAGVFGTSGVYLTTLVLIDIPNNIFKGF